MTTLLDTTIEGFRQQASSKRAQADAVQNTIDEQKAHVASLKREAEEYEALAKKMEKLG